MKISSGQRSLMYGFIAALVAWGFMALGLGERDSHKLAALAVQTLEGSYATSSVVVDLARRPMAEGQTLAPGISHPSVNANAVMIRVIDGDTIVVRHQGVTTTVRLIGLDTPESVDPRRTVECFGREASAKMVELLPVNSSVMVETDSTQGPRDTYSRLLAYVFRADGLNINREMIVQGYGQEYTYRVAYQHQADFRAAEQDAKQRGVGLWAEGACD